ncbi:hypothetical protein [Methanosarcina mazei]|jgi:hypothetical protein|nr:hypothetical protein [Methanosarcina mazei]
MSQLGESRIRIEGFQVAISYLLMKPVAVSIAMPENGTQNNN